MKKMVELAKASINLLKRHFRGTLVKIINVPYKGAHTKNKIQSLQKSDI